MEIKNSWLSWQNCYHLWRDNYELLKSDFFFQNADASRCDLLFNNVEIIVGNWVYSSIYPVNLSVNLSNCTSNSPRRRYGGWFILFLSILFRSICVRLFCVIIGSGPFIFQSDWFLTLLCLDISRSAEHVWAYSLVWLRFYFATTVRYHCSLPLFTSIFDYYGFSSFLSFFFRLFKVPRTNQCCLSRLVKCSISMCGGYHCVFGINVLFFWFW